jgi:hypothetical protein
MLTEAASAALQRIIKPTLPPLSRAFGNSQRSGFDVRHRLRKIASVAFKKLKVLVSALGALSFQVRGVAVEDL